MQSMNCSLIRLLNHNISGKSHENHLISSCISREKDDFREREKKKRPIDKHTVTMAFFTRVLVLTNSLLDAL